jgi:hypothetical protein
MELGWTLSPQVSASYRGGYVSCRRDTDAMKSMTRLFAYPSDLAELVRSRLRAMHARSPALSALKEMLEVAFFASMKTEEAEQVLCNLAYVDMNNPDPSPPKRIVADRWSYVRFEDPIIFDVKNLVKISKSIDSSFGALAVYKNASGNLVIWGAIDQQGQRAAYTTREADEGPESPGVLQVSICGVGVIEVYRGYTLLGALRQGHLTYGFSDVLEQPGPIQSILQDTITSTVRRVEAEVGTVVFHKRNHWADSISTQWRQALARILLGLQRYGHGGAILLTPDDRNAGLSIKYPIEYRRLGDALRRLSVQTINLCDAEDEIGEQFLDKNEEAMPVILHLDQAVATFEKADTQDEVTGCIRFIASLSRIDGVIFMNRELTVRGYGGIIKVKDEPSGVWVAGDAAGTVKTLREINPGHFGTRHQSMMRICYHRPGSIGFVISQDGDVRAMTRVRNRLTVWEDVKLRLA